MSLPQYPKYKNSGVAWLGDVPEHWEINPLKAIASLNDDVLSENTAPDFEIEYVDIGSVNLDKGISTTEIFLFKNAPSRARRIIKDGDVIISTVRTYLKAIAPICTPPSNLIVSTGFAVVRPKQKLLSKFAKYSLQNSGFVDEVIARSTGVSYPAINASDLACISIPVPSLSEQTTIAAFLDRETAKIDALIAEQEKLITLLAEKRQATISHAVTKGLNPNAPMKNSGVAWLGDVPEHWPVHSLRHNLKTVFNGTTAEQIDEGNFTVPVTRIETISSGKIDIGKLGYINENDARDDHLLIIGDILFSNINSLKMIGNCAQYYGDKTIYAGMNLLVLRPRDQINYIWLFWLIRSSLFRREIESRAKPAINQASIPQSSILSIQVTTPPVTEQTTIAAFLDRETAKIDALTAEAKRGIGLLKERRAALISAAVTGKVDVRGVV